MTALNHGNLPETPSAPLLLIIFNRPETTRRLIDRLREVKPPRVYVAADGPRPGVAGEAERCRQCREVVHEIDWPCDVRVRFSDINQGCRWGPVHALDWFFENEEAGIILEDDILPDPTFFPFCAEMLTRYADAKQVGCVCGYQFLASATGSYFFSRMPITWGWATWRDRWWDFAAVCENFERNLAAVPLRRWLSRHDAQDMKRKVREAFEGEHVWDFLWMFSLWTKERVTVLPARSLTRNVGIGPDATHTRTETSFIRAVPVAMPFPLQHPEKIEADRVMDRAIFHELLHTPTLAERCVSVAASGRPVGRLAESLRRRLRILRSRFVRSGGDSR